ncbi:MAG: serine hydrolase [Acidobacteriota bacterium]|nr:serine hydrolase [Acidobacteriota bacterium]
MLLSRCIALIALVLVTSARAEDFAAQADAYISALVQQNKFSGSVLAAKDGKPLFRKGYLLANREWNIPNGPDTRFRLGSITKQFTATAILQLAEQGKLKVDDPISKYYEASPASWAKVTIHHLLTHSSGIPSYTSMPGFFAKQSRDDRTPEEIIQLTQDKPLEFEPGSKWNYDNTGYILLGYVVEKASGEKYADYVRTHIFEPLGMRDTGYDMPVDIVPHRAAGYDVTPKGWRNSPYLAMSLPYAAGSLYSTVDDLLIWDQAIYAGKLLTPESWKRMFTAHIHEYGYGWGVDEQFHHRQISHGGGINGFATFIARFPDDKVTVIALGNTSSSASGQIAKALAGMLFGEKIAIPAPKVEVKIDTKLLDRYPGKYQLQPGMVLTVTREGDQLKIQLTGQPKFPMFPEGNNLFFLKVVDAELEFIAEPGGQAKAVILHQGGADKEAPRIATP